MELRERISYYARRTGLTRAAVDRYRRTPVAGWTRSSDRRISSSIRSLERVAANPDVTWGEWRTGAAKVVRLVREFLRRVLDLATFVERVAAALKRWLTRVQVFLEHPAGLARKVQEVLGN